MSVLPTYFFQTAADAILHPANEIRTAHRNDRSTCLSENLPKRRRLPRHKSELQIRKRDVRSGCRGITSRYSPSFRKGEAVNGMYGLFRILSLPAIMLFSHSAVFEYEHRSLCGFRHSLHSRRTNLRKFSLLFTVFYHRDTCRNGAANRKDIQQCEIAPIICALYPSPLNERGNHLKSGKNIAAQFPHNNNCPSYPVAHIGHDEH